MRKIIYVMVVELSRTHFDNMIDVVWRSTHVVSDTSLMASEVVWEDLNHMRGRIVGPWLLDAASGATQYERLAEYLCESNRCDPTDPNAGDHVA